MKRVLLLLLMVLLPIELSYAKGYKLGIVNSKGEDVIVRTRPGGKYLGILPYGLVIKVISRSEEKHNIGDDSYYEVQFGNLKGWSWSGYFKVPKSQGSLKLDESKISFAHLYKIGKTQCCKRLS